MVILVVLFVLLFLLFLFSMPVIVTARARISPSGAILRGSVTLFGALSIPVKARLNLFHAPFLTVQAFGKTFPLLGGDPPQLNRNAIRAERIELGVTLGVAQDGARTVQLLGTFEVLLTLLLPLVFRRVRITPHPSFEREMFRMNAEVVGLVFPLFLFLTPKRIKRTKPTNDNENPLTEKRYTHVPC
ncbi:MAG: hypothetical protein IJP98_00415 [Clostridia bacterium]|nr:hypothetical protein [Clostridia bacterium]